MRNVVIVDGTRTAFGKMGGTVRQCWPADLLGTAIKGLLKKTELLERGGKVDSVLAGSALGDGHVYNFSRYTSIYAGLPYETSAAYVEMQCGSAITSINYAARLIATGDKDIIVAGGAESHSQAIARFSTSVEPYKMNPPALIKPILSPYVEDNMSMLQIADAMAQKWNITREECDEFALRSQKRAAAAIEKGYFKEEIIPVEVPVKKGPAIQFDYDEHVRPESTMEGLTKLRPIFAGGVTTAGNASGMNDGGACVLMMDEETALKLGYKPIARWIDGTDVGVDPKLMGIGPAYSNACIMKRNQLKISDIDVYECNEAFAAQNLSVIKEMEAMFGEKINQDNWNPNGGAIAFGHANGASGARIGILAMKELQRRGSRYGLFCSCCGGGLGVSTLIERYDG